MWPIIIGAATGHLSTMVIKDDLVSLIAVGILGVWVVLFGIVVIRSVLTEQGVHD